jgi:hypothetical protein
MFFKGSFRKHCWYLSKRLTTKYPLKIARTANTIRTADILYWAFTKATTQTARLKVKV